MWERHKREVERLQAALDESSEQDAKGFALAKEAAAKGGRVAPPGMLLATLDQINEHERRAAERSKQSAARLTTEIGVRDLLWRLLTRTEMQPVWTALAKRGDYEGNITHSYMFAVVARRAWMGPREEEAWTPTVRRQWLTDVASLAEKLAGKVERTGAEDFLWRSGIEGQPWTSDLLRELGRSAGRFLAPARLSRPRDPLARRAYFVRIMAKWCRAELGGPCVNLITPTAIVALSDDKLTDRQVYRLIEEEQSIDTKRPKKPRKRH